MNSKSPGENESNSENGPANVHAEVNETLRDTKEKIKAKSKEVANEAREQGETYVRQGKDRAAERIGTVSESVRQTAERFEREEDPNIARYTRLLADKLDHVATYVRQHDLNQLRNDTEDLVRRHPTVVFGGLFVAGLAAARFLKASSSRNESSPPSEHGNEESHTEFPQTGSGDAQEATQSY